MVETRGLSDCTPINDAVSAVHVRKAGSLIVRVPEGAVLVEDRTKTDYTGRLEIAV